ncbi:hypothetical protein FRC04_001060 [Tulasnella sp. 424]|nr:hypothetical protein FRC04_001060 [Tulasnella sp. 424]KAG8969844.1 hypothetical protein FRC05_000821 [Tulasnella sp. 425]
MPFGEIVIGSPGSGKSTYAYGKYQLLSALNRKCIVVNLDPANDPTPYPSAISLSELITLKDAMEEFGLGPNGGMLYCVEYLEANYDWLEGRLKEEIEKEKEKGGGNGDDPWVVFDLPGQVELSTNHDSLKHIVDKLAKSGFRLAAVHLCDAHYITDASKYVSVLLLSLRTMLHLGLPHVNVLSKLDLISKYGDLDFNLDFYTEVQDLSHIANVLKESHPRFGALTMAICDLVEDFGLVGFETMAVEDKQSMVHLMRVVDRALGYAFVASDKALDDEAGGGPSKSRSEAPNTNALFSSALSAIPDTPHVRDIQERWIDSKDEYDKWEEGEWRREGVVVAEAKAREKAAEAEAKRQAKAGGAGGIRKR